MTPAVHILCTVRNPALLAAASLVFKTLRTGFPTAPVVVHGNGLDRAAAAALFHEASSVGAEQFLPQIGMSHDQWVEDLVLNEPRPFWICDTDMVFFGPVENWFADMPLVTFAGRFEPEFMEEWSGTRHMARLHTCLMYFNPALLRPAMRGWMGCVPSLFNRAQANLIRQTFVPLRAAGTLFFDTCAGLYHAIGSRPFTDAENLNFEHLHCGTYADLISGHLSLENLEGAHQAIYADPTKARGLQQEQAKYYKLRAPRQILHVSSTND